MMQRFDVLVVGAGPAGSATAIHLARGGTSVLLADRARFPRDKPCGGGITGRALQAGAVRHRRRSSSASSTPSSFGSTTGAASGARSTEPLILMTQRRRLDAHLAEQAAAAGATFRDNARVDALEIGADGITATVGGSAVVGADTLVGADGANGIVAKAVGLEDGIVRGVALEGNVGWEHLDRERYRVDRRGRARPAGRAATAGCSRRASTRTSASAAGTAKARTCATISRGSARTYGIDPDALTDVRGHRLPMRRVGATTPARDNVVLVGDAAGLVDPLSGDGMYEAFTSARLAAEAILAGDLGGVPGGARADARPPRGRVVVGEARARPPSRACASGPLARRASSASSAGCCAATSGIRTRRGASPGRRCASLRASRAASDDNCLGEGRTASKPG